MIPSRRPVKLLALLLCALIVFASFFPALEAVHDCSGEDCVVCALIVLWDNLLRQLLPGLALFCAAAALVSASILRRDAAAARASATLTTQKIKLLN